VLKHSALSSRRTVSRFNFEVFTLHLLGEGQNAQAPQRYAVKKLRIPSKMTKFYYLFERISLSQQCNFKQLFYN